MKNQTNQNRLNVYQMVTDRIIDELQKGIIPWRKPWTGAADGAINYVSRKPYSMLNQMLLGKPGEWLTWKQVHDLGGSVKAGAVSGIVTFFTTATRRHKVETNEEGEEEVTVVTKLYDYPVLKYYRVFHIDDCTGIESKFTAEVKVNDPIETAENIISGYLSRESNLKFHNDQPSDRAFYSPSQDSVTVPMFSQYEVVEEYYSTTYHELVHSTMAKGRCDRTADNKNAAFGSEDYSREELVAEIGSAMLCNISGIDSDKAFKNSVAYIQGWLKRLQDDNKAIIWAAARAEKAAAYIKG